MCILSTWLLDLHTWISCRFTFLLQIEHLILIFTHIHSGCFFPVFPISKNYAIIYTILKSKYLGVFLYDSIPFILCIHFVPSQSRLFHSLPSISIPLIISVCIMCAKLYQPSILCLDHYRTPQSFLTGHS